MEKTESWRVDMDENARGIQEYRINLFFGIVEECGHGDSIRCWTSRARSSPNKPSNCICTTACEVIRHSESADWLFGLLVEITTISGMVGSRRMGLHVAIWRRSGPTRPFGEFGEFVGWLSTLVP